uniref:Phosphatidic acid phosphatase type 2/haloperoxidase domain-containing protein n=1 Tax=Lotharella globosa TaxID=91324 RepID=A0A7S4DF67_9EUKA
MFGDILKTHVTPASKNKIRIDTERNTETERLTKMRRNFSDYVICERKFISIVQPRPLGCGHPGYGMPSSHSQFMAYLAVYCVLWSYRRVKLDDYLWKILGNAGLCALAALVMYSRVALRYHTVNQVLVGAFVGSIFAIFWTALTAIYVDPEISKIEKWKITRMLYFRGHDHR